jgi:hypothetical protein
MADDGPLDSFSVGGLLIAASDARLYPEKAANLERLTAAEALSQLACNAIYSALYAGQLFVDFDYGTNADDARLVKQALMMSGYTVANQISSWRITWPKI